MSTGGSRKPLAEQPTMMRAPGTGEDGYAKRDKGQPEERARGRSPSTGRPNNECLLLGAG